MNIVVTKKDETIVVSINEENLLCKYSTKTFDSLTKLANEDLQKCTSMEEAVVIMDQVRSIVSAVGNIAERNFVETACKDHLVYDGTRGTYHLKTAKGDIVSKVPLPQALVDKILKSVEKGIDPSPIVKAVIRFFRNPNLSVSKLLNFVSYLEYRVKDHELYDKLIKTGHSVEMANEMSSFNETPLTTEGLLCTYKVSREVMNKYALDADGNKTSVPRYGKTINELTGEVTNNLPDYVEDRIFEPAVVGRRHDAFTTKSLDGKVNIKDHIYIVGNIHYLDSWKQVNCQDGTVGAPGLHFGNLTYIKGYEDEESTVTHNCFIDPSHIGAFTNSGNGAIRCLQGFIHSSKAGTNRGLYFPSVYAALVDEAWEEEKRLAIENSEIALEELKEASKERLTLLNIL